MWNENYIELMLYKKYFIVKNLNKTSLIFNCNHETFFIANNERVL